MTDNQGNAKKGKNNIVIWQQNINKSRTCQHDLISSGKLIEKGIDIVAFQEPSINTFNKTSGGEETETAGKAEARERIRTHGWVRTKNKKRRTSRRDSWQGGRQSLGGILRR